jgi:putative copper resistance protein D
VTTDVEQALALARFLHFSAAMLLFGSASFNGVVAPIALRPSFTNALRWPTISAVVLIVATAVAWLLIEAAQLGDGWSDAINPSVLGPLLTQTSFGQVWIARLGIAALLALSLALVGRTAARTLLLLSAVTLASLALVGHAAMTGETIGWVHRLNDAVHLLAAGFWLGCLPSVLVLVTFYQRGDLQADAVLALRRFSGVGHAAVALVLATGVVNTFLIVGKLPLDFSSPYQLLLATKIGLVATMVLIAVGNRYLVTPRLGTSAPRALTVGTMAELVLGAGVVTLVSVFGTFDPGS